MGCPSATTTGPAYTENSTTGMFFQVPRCGCDGYRGFDGVRLGGAARAFCLDAVAVRKLALYTAWLGWPEVGYSGEGDRGKFVVEADLRSLNDGAWAGQSRGHCD